MQNKRQTGRASYQWWAMDFDCFIWSWCLKLWVWRREELWGDFSQLCCRSLGFIAFLTVSHVSPVRPWPRPCNKTPLWRAWICIVTTSEMKGPRLGVRWGWDHEGRSAVKKYRKEGSRHSRMKVTLRKWQKAMQCSVDFQMHSSGWHLWWQGIGVFWCIWHVLARSWLKREQFIAVLFPKQVTLSFSNFRSSNQVWNGIPIIQLFWKLKWFTLLVTLPNCAGRSFRW